jgi:hypothetical protein
MIPLLVCSFVAGAVMLALFSAILQGKRLDGVRAPGVSDEDDQEAVMEARKARELQRLKLESPRATICNTSYSDRSVLLGDTDFKYCQFIRCRLIVDGPFSMESCFIGSSSLQSANAGKTLAIDGPRAERQLKRIRQKRVPLTTPGNQA